MKRGLTWPRPLVDGERPRGGPMAVPDRGGRERAGRGLPRARSGRRPPTAVSALNRRPRSARGGRRAAWNRTLGRVIDAGVRTRTKPFTVKRMFRAVERVILVAGAASGRGAGDSSERPCDERRAAEEEHRTDDAYDLHR